MRSAGGGRPSLLETLKGLIERTYAMRTEIERIDRYILGDLGFRRLYALRPLQRELGSECWPEARVLVSTRGAQLAATIYYPDALIAWLERYDPLRDGLDAHNIDAFGVFVEELDHLLTLADHAAHHRSLSLFELELHANVTKYYVAKHLVLKRHRRLERRGLQCWLRHHLFDKVRFDLADSPGLQARYQDARRMAVRLIGWLELRPAGERLRELRRFHLRPRKRSLELLSGASGGG